MYVAGTYKVDMNPSDVQEKAKFVYFFNMERSADCRGHCAALGLMTWAPRGGKAQGRWRFFAVAIQQKIRSIYTS